MRGRKPKPSRLRAIGGNPGKRPLNKDEPLPEPAVPNCPPELSEAAREEWHRLATQLAPLRLLTPLDRAALAAYCTAYALWAEAIKSIHEIGPVVKSPSGYPIQSPYLAIANRQAEIMMRIASEFGFTPLAAAELSSRILTNRHCLTMTKPTMVGKPRTASGVTPRAVHSDAFGPDRQKAGAQRTTAELPYRPATTAASLAGHATCPASSFICGNRGLTLQRGVSRTA